MAPYFGLLAPPIDIRPWPHTSAFKPRPPILGRQLFPIPAPLPPGWHHFLMAPYTLNVSSVQVHCGSQPMNSCGDLCCIYWLSCSSKFCFPDVKLIYDRCEFFCIFFRRLTRHSLFLFSLARWIHTLNVISEDRRRLPLRLFLWNETIFTESLGDEIFTKKKFQSKL